MSYGPVQQYSVAIATNAVTSAVLDLSLKSHTWISVYATAGAQLNVYGANSATAAPAQIVNLVPSTATVAFQALQIPSSVSGQWATFYAPPLEYVQFVATATAANGTTIYVNVSD